jgi:hypothetical protein
MSLAETASLNGLRAREIFRLVESGEIHFRETLEGLLFICPNSFLSTDGKIVKKADSLKTEL